MPYWTGNPSLGHGLILARLATLNLRNWIGYLTTWPRCDVGQRSLKLKDIPNVNWAPLFTWPEVAQSAPTFGCQMVRRRLAEDSAWSGRYLASETSGSFNAWDLRGWNSGGWGIRSDLWIWCWSPRNPQQVRFPMFYSNLISLNMTLLFLPRRRILRINMGFVPRITVASFCLH